MLHEHDVSVLVFARLCHLSTSLFRTCPCLSFSVPQQDSQLLIHGCSPVLHMCYSLAAMGRYLVMPSVSASKSAPSLRTSWSMRSLDEENESPWILGVFVEWSVKKDRINPCDELTAHAPNSVQSFAHSWCCVFVWHRIPPCAFP